MTAVVAHRGVWWWDCDTHSRPFLGYSDLWCRAMNSLRGHRRARHLPGVLEQAAIVGARTTRRRQATG